MRDDLAGKRFGMLVAVAPSEERKSGYIIWRCRCDCGNEILVESRYLKRNTIHDCGCVPRMKVKRDLRGKRFGKLTVLKPTDARSLSGDMIWICQCDCGKSTEAASSLLLRGGKKSCGCLAKPPRKDWIGKRFGRLEVISYAGKSNGHHMWACRCDCGRELEVRQSNLKSGHTTSCGCKFEPNEVRHMVDGTCVEIIASKKLFTTNTSGIRGVYLNKKSNRWIAQITFKGKTYYLGSYETKEEAAQARQLGEEMYTVFLEWYYNEYQKNKEISDQK